MVWGGVLFDGKNIDQSTNNNQYWQANPKCYTCSHFRLVGAEVLNKKKKQEEK